MIEKERIGPNSVEEIDFDTEYVVSVLRDELGKKHIRRDGEIIKNGKSDVLWEY